ncbi:hypothetical protein PV328_001879 [Microctonus aethiopoides]|uniref:Uncharacterized protein n=1 Tax=Microctonus aethiopoides TaxID=144406 RepID=A0AA39FYJ0_9HYME|nr:hypothetical protein PV328_001879 [Microctonus aethiopoides]
MKSIRQKMIKVPTKTVTSTSLFYTPPLRRRYFARHQWDRALSEQEMPLCNGYSIAAELLMTLLLMLLCSFYYYITLTTTTTTTTAAVVAPGSTGIAVGGGCASGSGAGGNSGIDYVGRDGHR